VKKLKETARHKLMNQPDAQGKEIILTNWLDEDIKDKEERILKVTKKSGNRERSRKLSL